MEASGVLRLSRPCNSVFGKFAPGLLRPCSRFQKCMRRLMNLEMRQTKLRPINGRQATSRNYYGPSRRRKEWKPESKSKPLCIHDRLVRVFNRVTSFAVLHERFLLVILNLSDANFI